MHIGLLRNRIQHVGTIEIIHDIRGSRINASTISTRILVGMRQGDDCPTLEAKLTNDFGEFRAFTLVHGVDKLLEGVQHHNDTARRI
ncbi:hypothetical protein D3C85_1716930 [compost metagenome]